MAPRRANKTRHGLGTAKAKRGMRNKKRPGAKGGHAENYIKMTGRAHLPGLQPDDSTSSIHHMARPHWKGEQSGWVALDGQKSKRKHNTAQPELKRQSTQEVIR